MGRHQVRKCHRRHHQYRRLANPTTLLRTSRKKMTSRRDVQLKTDLVAQYQPEKNGNGEPDK